MTGAEVGGHDLDRLAAVAVDVGGTSLKAGILGPSGLHVLRRVPSRRELGPDAVLDNITAVAAALVDECAEFRPRRRRSRCRRPGNRRRRWDWTPLGDDGLARRAGAPPARRTARSAGDCRPRRAHRSGGRGDVRGCCRRPLGAVRADRYRTRRRRRDRRGDPARGDVSGRRDRPDPCRPRTHARTRRLGAGDRRAIRRGDRPGSRVGRRQRRRGARRRGRSGGDCGVARRRRCPGHACSPEPWRCSTSRSLSSAGVCVARATR